MSHPSPYSTLTIDRLWRDYRENRDIETRNTLALANERLVGKVLQKYFWTYSLETQEDIKQAGFVGLLRAVELYDLELGFTFGTYAFHWIRQAMDRWTKNYAYEIRIPIRAHEQINRLAKGEEAFVIENQRPTRNREELADFMSLTPEKVDTLKDLSILRNLLELDEPLKEDGKLSLVEMLDDKERNNPFRILAEVEGRTVTIAILSEALEILPERSAQMLILYSGGLTLEEVAKLSGGVTRERVRQINTVSIRKLRVYFGVDPDKPIIWHSMEKNRHDAIVYEPTGEAMETVTNDNQLREAELKVAQLLWPKLSDTPIKLDLVSIATEAGINPTNLNMLMGGLAAKGVLKRVEGRRGLYSRGISVVTVGHKRNARSRMVSLNSEPTAPPIPEPSAPPEDKSGQNGQVTAPGPKAETPTATARTGVSDIDQAIQRFETMKIEIERRLEVLREARKVLAEPL